MAKLDIHSKCFETLNVNDIKCRFKNNIDILNECFGANMGMYMRACYPQSRHEFIWEANTGEKLFVWMPKLYSNNSSWKNIISDDGTIIHEKADGDRTQDWMEIDKHELNALRIVFIKPSSSMPYKFAGVFVNKSMKHLNHTYQRIATRIRLIGNPVRKVELLDDQRDSVVSQVFVQDETKEKPSWRQLTLEDILVIEKNISDLGLEGADKEAVIKQRVNQDIFRKRLLRRYDKCCLCDISNKDLLIASHIKPWASSLPNEKLDADNGFLFCPNHDKIFDKGLITFDDNGLITISSKLTSEEIKSLNISKVTRIDLHAGNIKYLKFHREQVFRQ